METNLIEQYVINQIDEKTKENETLKAKVAELEKQILVLKGAQDDGQPLDMQVPALGFSYDIYTYHYDLRDKETVERYKQALAEKDFDFLKNNNYYVEIYQYNYVLRIQGVEFKLEIENLGNEFVLHQYKEKPYKTIEEAKAALLAALQKDIDEYEAKHKEETK